MKIRTAFVCCLLVQLVCAAAIAQEQPKDANEFKLEQSWGEIRYLDGKLVCSVSKIPQNRLLSLPQFHNPIGRIYSGKKSSKSGFKIKIRMKDWQVVLPKSFDAKQKVMIEIKGKPRRVGRANIETHPTTDNAIVLHAHLATVHGKKLRYEPQPHKNTLGYWAEVGDWAAWKFKINKPGKYRVKMLQGCGKGQGGSDIEIVVGQQKLKHRVVDTGHFQNFVPKELGTLQLPAGPHTLQLRAIKKAKNAVMDVRQIELTHVEQK